MGMIRNNFFTQRKENAMEQKWRTIPMETGLHILYMCRDSHYVEVHVKSLVTNEVILGNKLVSIAVLKRTLGDLLWLKLAPAPPFDEVLAAELETI